MVRCVHLGMAGFLTVVLRCSAGSGTRASRLKQDPHTQRYVSVRMWEPGVKNSVDVKRKVTSPRSECNRISTLNG